MGEMGNLYRILVRKSEGKKPLGRQDIHRKKMLKWILNRMWTGLKWVRIGFSGQFL
jgi:hypothetical protein